MTIKQIELVITIAREGSINKAAKKLFQSQSNISTSLKNLETELGQPLFERKGNGMELTDFGTDMITIAQPVFNQYKILNDYLESSRQPAQVRFSVACQYFRFASMLFSEICRKYEDAPHSFSFLEGGMFEIINMVHNHEAELGVIVIPSLEQKLIMYTLRQNDIKYKCLIKLKASVIVREGHPLTQSGKTMVSINELHKYTYIRHPDASYNTFKDWNAMSLSNSRKQITVTGRGSLYEILTRTDAFTLALHKGSVYDNNSDYPGITELQIEGHTDPMEIGCIQSLDHRLSPIAEEYLSLLQDRLK